MNRKPDVSRRTYLLGLGGAAAVGVGVPAAVSGGGSDERAAGQPDDVTDAEDFPVAQPFVGTLDGDVSFDVEMRYDGNPAVDDTNDGETDDAREWVVHCTTDGAETNDYPAMMVNVRERVDEAVTLGDLGDGEFAFDFFVGPKHDQYIPGQVFLALQPPGYEDEDRAVGMYKNVRRGGERGTWRTLDVADEMTEGEVEDARGQVAPWRTVELPTGTEQFGANFESFADAILQRAMDTRDEGTEINDVVAEYGEETELLGVGVGTGSSTTPSVRDIYFDALRIPGYQDDGATEDVADGAGELDFPVALQMDASFDSQGQITATLEFPDTPEDVSLDDVLEDTVRLYPYSQIAPPLGDGAEPRSVDVSENRIQATFPPGRVRSLERLGGGEQLVTVAGEFDYDHVVWFYGVGEVSVPGN